MRFFMLGLSVFLFLAPGAHSERTEHLRCHHAAVPFTDSGSEPARHYGRGTPYDVRHIYLDATVDFGEESLRGTVTHTLAPVGMAATSVRLDAIGLDIAAVRGHDGTALDFDVTDEKLIIYPATPLPADQETTIAIDYAVVRPEKGLHFRTPRMGYSEAETQCWTQGEPEDTRYWLPCFDFPNERTTTEIRIQVPEGHRGLSNGDLIAQNENTWHWKLEQEHVPYLINLVVGQFVEITEEVDGIPLAYYVLPGFEEEAKNTFNKTADMMRFFQERLGMKYPWSQYSQVCVADFIAGGMENTTLTTLTERTLHDDAAHQTYSSDGLVAHELAHQWFGDLLTCRDWSHLWLNEGFATYCEVLYTHHDLGPEAASHELWSNAQRVFDIDRDGARAPIVRNTYGSPDDLFTARVYEKGGWVLHMLRHKLGDDLFFEGVRSYLATFRNGVVETNDLMRTFEKVSGVGLEGFFDQWVYHGGYPMLDIQYEWKGDHAIAQVIIDQKQTVDEKTPLFAFDSVLRFVGEDWTHDEPISVSEQEHTFHVKLPGKPDYVRFDPGYTLLAKVNFRKSRAMNIAQLQSDETITGRYLAIQALGKLNSGESVVALKAALENDAFWGVRAEAAEALAQVEDDSALDALLSGADDPEAKVRRAVAGALARIDEPESVAALRKMVQEDESPYVVSSAISSLEKLHAEIAADDIVAAMGRDSHNQVVRNAAYRALAQLEQIDAIDAIVTHTGKGAPRMSRATAIRALGNAAKWQENPTIAREVLEALLDDPHPSILSATLDALAALGDERSIDPLEKFVGTTRSDSLAKRAEGSIEKIRSRRAQTEELKTLRTRVNDLSDENEELTERLGRLEGLVDAITGEDDPGE